MPRLLWSGFGKLQKIKKFSYPSNFKFLVFVCKQVYLRKKLKAIEWHETYIAKGVAKNGGTRGGISWWHPLSAKM